MAGWRKLACVAAALMFLPQTAALAAELVVVTNQGAMPSLQELAAAFGRATGDHVTVKLAAGDIERALKSGAVDLVSQNPGPMAQFVKSGGVIAGSVAPFQLAELGVAVKAGARKPDIRTVESFKSALLAARSIGYSRGCSGTNIGKAIAQLGLTDTLKARTVFTGNGPVTDYLARGDFELGLQQTNIMEGVKGVDFVGPVPAPLNRRCESDIAVAAGTHAPDAARELMRFVTSPAAAPLIRKTHAEPFR